MSNIRTAAFVAATILAASACTTPYRVGTVSRTRILVDSRYDKPVAEAEAFLRPYSQKVDSVMKPVVGTLAHDMAAARPESDLSNLLADIMVWGGGLYGEKPDFGVYNMGGIRASLSKGQVTYGDVLDVAPFENKICFFSLRGDKVMQLFREMAAVGGEGVSGNVRLEITRDGQLRSATIDGHPVDPAREYRVTTIDYLSQGNDHLDAFKSKTDLNFPTGPEANSRAVICKYFEAMAAQGKAVDSRLEGRIKIVE